MGLSRRKFIGQASCAAIGSTTALSTLINLLSVNTAAARPAATNNDYKALVCILLAGGNDSFNMVVPTDSASWMEYSTTRSTLALPTSRLTAIAPNNAPNGKTFGLHEALEGTPPPPEMPNPPKTLSELFDLEKLCFINNVGTLAEPIANRTGYLSPSTQKPLGLFSHSDQIQQWQTSVPRDRQAVGWGGRMADILSEVNGNQNVSMNISLSGKNVFQAGDTVSEYSIKNTGNGAVGLEAIPYIGNAGFLTDIRNIGVDNMIAQNYANLFQSTLADLTQNSIDSQQQFSQAIAAVDPLNTNFSAHYLSQNMQMVAKTIAARTDLNMNRQTFFMTFGGWDHHDEVLNNQDAMFEILGNAMKELYSALEELGMEDKVTTFTISDFGRTLTSNGNGSDHAWGGNHMVMGGAVNGKKFYGKSNRTYPNPPPGIFPSLALDYGQNPLNVSSRGSLIPTIAVDEYFAELALWFGVSSMDLAMVLPNLMPNFYTPGSGMPIGFMK